MTTDQTKQPVPEEQVSQVAEDTNPTPTEDSATEIAENPETTAADEQTAAVAETTEKVMSDDEDPEATDAVSSEPSDKEEYVQEEITAEINDTKILDSLESEEALSTDQPEDAPSLENVISGETAAEDDQESAVVQTEAGIASEIENSADEIKSTDTESDKDETSPAEITEPEAIEAIESEEAAVGESAAAEGRAMAAKDMTTRPEGPGQESTMMDFSEEEARLAADSPEFDLGEEHDEADTASVSSGDYDLNGKSKREILDIFAELLAAKPIQSLRKDVEAIKVAFYKIHRADEEQLRKTYLESGGAPEDFSPTPDPDEQRLKDLFGEYRRRRDEFISNLERSKQDNMQVKLGIIEELKELIGSSETMNNTFTTFRDLQQRWKDAGPVPQANIKDLWETYNYHVENFYSFIKINKELRDLDLRKNYEAKVALCEEAEALILEPSIVNAFHKLQKLHEQWRETGPVSHEYKETLWQRFREASSRINKQHQEYFELIKDEQKSNLELKTELCAKTEELAASVLTSRKDWNQASDKLLEIQKVWKTIGFAPKKDNARIYERFRLACDRFFEQKRNFYSQLKTELDHNLQLKTEICEAAEALRNSEEWKKTTDELIALQKRWKEIGPVPRRNSDAIWKRFRSACDSFFERKSQHFSTLDDEYGRNLELKKALLEEIAQCDINEGGFDMIKEYQRRWSEIGFVPIKQKEAIQKEYKAVMDKLFATLRGSDKSRQMDRFKGKVQSMKTSGDRRLRFERERLYNKVKQLESDIALLENNIGFFSKSKNAEAMIKEVRDKIDRAKEEMAAAIEKINLIDNEE